MSISRIRTKLLLLFVPTVLVMGAMPGVSEAASGTWSSERTPLQPAPTQYWASERTPVDAVPFGDLDPAIRNVLLRRQAAASLPPEKLATTRPASADGGFAWLDAAIGGITVGGLLLVVLVSVQFVQRGLHKPRSL